MEHTLILPPRRNKIRRHRGTDDQPIAAGKTIGVHRTEVGVIKKAAEPAAFLLSTSEARNRGRARSK
ncbi:MAG: hypothetical protein KGK16_13090, partial [Bradyrhizobium sp.]|nr:hypothetical protein [Bradyrhizobium sp.]